jgi:hypothetical protein
VPDPAHAQRILTRVAGLSAPMGTIVRVEGGTATVLAKQ